MFEYDVLSIGTKWRNDGEGPITLQAVNCLACGVVHSNVYICEEMLIGVSDYVINHRNIEPL